MKIAIIIPCFNEAGSIAGFVESLHAVRKEHNLDLTPVVVNDCSKDDTLSVARSLDCTVLDLPINLGIGGAVQCGFRYAFQHGFDLAIQMDGDGQHPAAQLPKLLAVFGQPDAEVVIGSRFLDKEGFQSTALRRLGIRWFTRLIFWLTGKKVYDPTSGFRAMSRKPMGMVAKNYPREYPEPEILIHFITNNFKVIEVPVVMQERLSGNSSISSWKTAYYMVRVSFGIIFSFIRYKIYGRA